jgi:hypothetical protein
VVISKECTGGRSDNRGMWLLVRSALVEDTTSPDLMSQKEAWLCDWIKVIVSRIVSFCDFFTDFLLAGLDSECSRL